MPTIYVSEFLIVPPADSAVRLELQFVPEAEKGVPSCTSHTRLAEKMTEERVVARQGHVRASGGVSSPRFSTGSSSE